MKSVILNPRFGGKSRPWKLPFLIGLALLLSLLPAAGLGSPLRALAAGPLVEYVNNGGFETGDFSGWRVSHCGPFPVVQGEKSSQGQYAAHMGDGGEELFNPLRIASIAQEITLPPWAENPLLKLAYLVGFGEELEGYEFEGNEWFWLEVLIDDRQVLYACSHTGDWQDYEYDLSEYIGETFTLTVRTVLDREKFNLPEGIEIFSISYHCLADPFPRSRRF